ncbi:hypothetical protein HI914_05359 [Erysiphe necator]|nr:hypothetical protein HI914_05359 [Erysiphe necator]
MLIAIAKNGVHTMHPNRECKKLHQLIRVVPTGHLAGILVIPEFTEIQEREY